MNAYHHPSEACLAAGMDGYISKPLSPKTLFEQIEALTSLLGRPLWTQ